MATRRSERNLQPKVARILRNAAKYHAKYYKVQTFGGPSLHFHRRALGLEGSVNQANRAELIYAVLSSWGMHRMGKGGSKMQPFAVFRKSLDALRPDITAARRLRPGKVGPKGWARLKHIFRSVKVMASGTTLVGNSKVMAHVLPNIVAPIDRQYTLKFLFGSTYLQNDIRKEWSLMRKILEDFFFSVVCDCGFVAQATKWQSSGRYSWDTSLLKIADNLVIGAMK